MPNRLATTKSPSIQQVSYWKSMLTIMQSSGYVGEFERIADGRGDAFRVELVGAINRCGYQTSAFSKRADFDKWESRYLPARDFGLLIVSTNQGVMNHHDAKKRARRRDDYWRIFSKGGIRMPALDSLTHKIPLPNGVSASIEDNMVVISKDGASITREFRNSRLSISVDDNSIIVFCDLPGRKHKAIAGTWAAHLKNMVRD